MRDGYYAFISSKGIQDTLSWVEDISYSKKYELLRDLLEKYSVEQVNRALGNYDLKYIKSHRTVPSYMLKNILIDFCKRIEG